ncbi:MAG: hypothetical protein JW984_14035 [Deltaproteobacteria bacterium]|uniref:Type II secretion system protein n=1 Tax=Candidatus Zymogenus saltonus TaxID=2844893 RepID=A0A9D8KGL1_9DELT|nr:hypothetical protein [Candidatus Zymogenus saltonus]
MVNRTEFRGIVVPLLVSVSLVALIVAGFFGLAVPIFHTFSFKKKQAEAQRLLEKIYQSELSYFSRHGCFDSDPDVIGFVPDSKRQDYTWKILKSDCRSFLARAWTNIDDDEHLDIWEITEADRWIPLHVYNDSTDTGVEIDPTRPFPTNIDDTNLQR